MRVIKVIVFSLFAILLENSHAFTVGNESDQKTEQGLKMQDMRQSNSTPYWTPKRISEEGTHLEQELGGVGIHLPPGGSGTAAYNPYNLEGVWLILGTKYQEGGAGGFVTPEEAKAIDIALTHGDGNPRLGSVRIFDGADVTPYSCIKSTGEYNLENKMPVCIVLIKLPPGPKG